MYIVHRCKNCRTLLCRTYPWVGGVPACQPGRQKVVLLLGVYAGQVAVSALGPYLLPARSARLVPRRLQIFLLTQLTVNIFLREPYREVLVHVALLPADVLPALGAVPGRGRRGQRRGVPLAHVLVLPVARHRPPQPVTYTLIDVRR